MSEEYKECPWTMKVDSTYADDHHKTCHLLVFGRGVSAWLREHHPIVLNQYRFGYDSSEAGWVEDVRNRRDLPECLIRDGFPSLDLTEWDPPDPKCEMCNFHEMKKWGLPGETHRQTVDRKIAAMDALGKWEYELLDEVSSLHDAITGISNPDFQGLNSARVRLITRRLEQWSGSHSKSYAAYDNAVKAMCEAVLAEYHDNSWLKTFEEQSVDTKPKEE